MNTILITIITLATIGTVLGVALFFVASKFKVYEDPRIDAVEAILPAANCGGCGYPGCRNFADACVKAESLDKLYCPVGGNDAMAEVAKVLGLESVAKEPHIAVVRCSGSFDHRPKTNVYDSAGSCEVAAYLYAGDTGCAWGCLGLGDCVRSCKFDSIHMDITKGLPVVDEATCTACGACVTACPKNIIDLIPRGFKNRRIYVACMNEDKGAAAKKNCAVACTGCTLCQKECAYDAIEIVNGLARIDQEKCKKCRKCVPVCRTGAIIEQNFPERKIIVKDQPID